MLETVFQNELEHNKNMGSLLNKTIIVETVAHNLKYFINQACLYYYNFYEFFG